MRCVERFERNLFFKGASALTAEQARKRLRLVVPFIFNPFVGFFLMKLLFAKGKMIYGNRAPLRGMEVGIDVGQRLSEDSIGSDREAFAFLERNLNNAYDADLRSVDNVYYSSLDDRV
ncbi:MAG: hypothetical protein D6698_02800 [Gammaproteobacteria bacterium]|nr:MAG: hypothetical protein D6698_02800 [Gammaproteobacteria bacterium]